MACEDCKKMIDKGLNGEGGMTAYYRWDNANVAIIGCAKHLRQMMAGLNSLDRQAFYGK